MRKRVIHAEELEDRVRPGELDIPSTATVLVTSEHGEHPVEHAFDTQRGHGASRWVAGGPGEQMLILRFDRPQAIRRAVLEIEEREVQRSQELVLSVSSDGGEAYRELIRQEYNFSPPGTTYEREDWQLDADAVTHLRLTIRPDRGGGPGRATITSLVLQ